MTTKAARYELGRYLHRETGEIFALTIGTKLDGDALPQKVYKLKNSEHYHECTKAEFEAQFEQEF